MSLPDLCQRFGEEHDLQVLLFEPLFEEANRTRRMIAQLAGLLAEKRMGVTVACLTGTGENLTNTSEIRLQTWREEAATLAAHFKPVVIASIRGGALLPDAAFAKAWWRFAPETGARIVRDLKRTQTTGEMGLYAGNRLSEGFLTDLEAAEPAGLTPVRTVRLDSDAADADAKVAGSPLWRRAEPGEDLALAEALADDLADWVRTCADC